MEGLSLLLLSLLRKIICVIWEMRRKIMWATFWIMNSNYIPVKDRVAKSVFNLEEKQNPIPNRIYSVAFLGFLKASDMFCASYQPWWSTLEATHSSGEESLGVQRLLIPSPHQAKTKVDKDNRDARPQLMRLRFWQRTSTSSTVKSWKCK